MYKRVLNFKKILWIPYASIFDDSKMIFQIPSIDQKTPIYQSFATDGHIDGFARFVSLDTIFYEEQDILNYVSSGNKFLIEETKKYTANIESLKKATDQDGNPFKLIPIPKVSLIVYEDSNEEPLYKLFMCGDINRVYKKKRSMKFARNTSYMNFLILNDIVVQNEFWASGIGMDDSIKKQDMTTKKSFRMFFLIKKLNLEFEV